ncbi:hypothetical protein BAZMOX_551499_0 [methanotrophic endosymbiont of Bathymodiolus azoricus (Menez Gwen)]|nr:hypothetical protein BAZMOX_551499_0 [methanotrophic endosymbiont of Bathymodiolus azoricus (Menez Gwen)]
MNLNALKNTEELQSFLDGSPAVAFGYVASIIENEHALSSGITILLKP